MILVKINLSKIPKDKIFVGTKGKYIDVLISPRKDGADEYGNTHNCQLSQTKEEREAKADKIYLGNGKEIIFGGDSQQKAEVPIGFDDDLPF